MGNFVVEQTGRKTVSKELLTESLKWIWLLALTTPRLRSPFSMHIMDCIFPGFTGIWVDFPSVLLLWASPVGNGETLKQGTWHSVESDITNTLQQGLWVKVLHIDVVHDVWLLVEFVDIGVLDSETYIILN